MRDRRGDGRVRWPGSTARPELGVGAPEADGRTSILVRRTAAADANPGEPCAGHPGNLRRLSARVTWQLAGASATRSCICSTSSTLSCSPPPRQATAGAGPTWVRWELPEVEREGYHALCQWIGAAALGMLVQSHPDEFSNHPLLGPPKLSAFDDLRDWSLISSVARSMKRRLIMWSPSNIGSMTVETRFAMGTLAVDSLAAHFAGAPPLSEVE
jgi:hypothetical protein